MKIIGIALATLVAGCAAAPERAAPALEPGTGAPPPVYRSAFEGYQGFADQELMSWRGANDEVRSAGGHMGILRSHGGHK